MRYFLALCACVLAAQNTTEQEMPGHVSASSKVLLFQNQNRSAATRRLSDKCCRGHTNARHKAADRWTVKRLEPNLYWSCAGCDCKDLRDRTGDCPRTEPLRDWWKEVETSEICMKNPCAMFSGFGCNSLRYKFRLKKMELDRHGGLVTDDSEWLQARPGRNVRCVPLTDSMLALHPGEHLMIELTAVHFPGHHAGGGTTKCRKAKPCYTDRIFLGTVIYNQHAGKKTLSCYPRDHRKHPDCRVVANR